MTIRKTGVTDVPCKAIECDKCKRDYVGEPHPDRPSGYWHIGTGDELRQEARQHGWFCDSESDCDMCPQCLMGLAMSVA